MKILPALLCVSLIPACLSQEEEVGDLSQATTGSGTSATVLGKGTFEGPFKVKPTAEDWELEIEASNDVFSTVQKINFAPGGHTGWHTHPGQAFVTVLSGTFTFYDSDCIPTVKTVGQGYLDGGGHAHIGRNETAAPGELLVVFLTPPGAPLRIDLPAPSTCLL